MPCPEWRSPAARVTGFALILDKEGEPIQPGGAPTFGASIGDTRLSGDFVYRQGLEPTRADQVAIDARTAEAGRLPAR